MISLRLVILLLFFFNDTATTEIYTLSLHDALPITLGCRLNQVDTQQIQAALEASGFRTVAFDEPADVVVVNTCTVTARAEFSDRQMIRRAARVREGATLVVTGCWAQTSPGDVAAMAEVDLVVGNGDKHRLPEL